MCENAGKEVFALEREENRRISGSLKSDMNYLNTALDVEKNFDVIYRVISFGGREACMYLVDGFCKDELIQSCCSTLWIKSRRICRRVCTTFPSSLPLMWRWT